MSFTLSRFIKGLRVSKENTTNPSNIDIVPSGTAGTTTTLQGSQTANRTVLLPNENGTILTTGSTIDLDQLEAVTASRALQSNGAGHIEASSVTNTELGYVSGATSAIQTQINTVSGNLTTETAARIAADALKANLTLNNILPSAAVDINGQKITNSAAPTVGSDLTNKTYVDAAVTGGGANLSLSNLTTTSINQDLLPGSTNTRSVGSASLRWANLFVSTIQNASAAVLDAVNSRLVSGATTKLDWSGTDISVNTRKITNVVDPSSAQDAATKNYVDTNTPTTKSVIVSQDIFNSVSVAAGYTPINFNNVSRNDMPGSFNATTFVFTAPYAGKYSITFAFYAAGSLNIGSSVTGAIRINGSNATFRTINGISATSLVYQINTTELMSLALNDTVQIVGSSGGTLTSNASSNFLTITFLGA